MRLLKDMKLKNKKVLVRVDFNVPLANGVIRDDSRITKALPTIKYILKKKAHQIILISHFGRPNGEYEPQFSMAPIAKRLQELLGKEVYFETNPIILNINSLEEEKIVLLENLRFTKGEEENYQDFAAKLASFADVFVLDAFGAAHRAHASIVGIQNYLPSCAGMLLEQEIKYLSMLLRPKRPYVAIIGGAKSDKIKVVDSMLEKADMLIVAGILANTFLKAKGIPIGNSSNDQSSLDYAKNAMETHKNIAVPVDFILEKNNGTRVAGIGDDIEGWSIKDIGPYTITGYKDILKKAKTIFWGGPIGVYEDERFRRGTWDIARFIAELNCTKIIGGGDSADAIISFGLASKMTHVSTGGGASLEFISGKKLPGVSALEENKEKFRI